MLQILCSRNPIIKNVAGTNKHVMDRFMSLPQSKMVLSKVLATYVWIDGTGKNVRSKTMTLDKEPVSVDELPWWNFDGSSTKQAYGDNSDVYIKPVAVFNDPFTLNKNKIVLCETFTHDKKPTGTNKRDNLVDKVERAGEEGPVFTCEQEFTLKEPTNWPLGWPSSKGFNQSIKSSYYCSTGSDNTYGRDIAQSVYKACLYAGVNVVSCDSTEIASKWRLVIGGSNGDKAFDNLWMARYIIHRVSEDFGLIASLDDPLTETKPEFKRNGALVKFSTTKRLTNDPDCPVFGCT